MTTTGRTLVSRAPTRTPTYHIACQGRRMDAALKSFRSSSDHESDQSILGFGARSANLSASADSSVAAAGGNR